MAEVNDNSSIQLFEDQKIRTAWAVSYTHLDVYKRQLHTNGIHRHHGN